jgi:hypothetical protein
VIEHASLLGLEPNPALLDLSRQILDLTKAIHARELERSA